MSRLQIVVPGREPKYVCRVPVGDGETCGAIFFDGEERRWQRHVGLCAGQHLREIHAESPRERLPAIHGDPDPEATAHLRRVGERMVREGRLELRKNERIES